MSIGVTTGRPTTNRPLAATPAKKRCLTINPPITGEKHKTIVVLGVERGGTSMAAGMLRALGIDLGKRVGLNHEDPRFITTDHNRLKQVIAVRDREADVWGFKMPNAATILDFFEANLRNPYYLIVYRNLASVADSWQQRGTGEYLGAIDRGLELNRLIVEHLRRSKRPAMIVNYERAVADKNGTVDDVVGFLGLAVDDEAVERAIGIMAGDGQGYLNLPEYFFAVEPKPISPERATLATDSNASEIIDADGWITFENMKKKLVLRLANGAKLPQKFWMRLDIDAPRGVDLRTLPLRIYFDFVGEMFPAHCARPSINRGQNAYLVETSGMATAIGFGPLLPNTRFKLSVELLEASLLDE